MSRQPLIPLIKSQQIFIFQFNLTTRITDMNYGNHLAATAMPSMMHQVRLKFLQAQGFSEFDIGGPGLVVSDIYVHYQSEVFFDEELLFRLGVESVDKYSADFVYQVYNQTRQRPVAIAKERIIFFDYQKKRVAPTAEQFIKTIQHLETGKEQCPKPNSTS